MATSPGVGIAIAGKRFGDDQLYDELRLDIAPSSVVALVGPSGIGKSTLLRMIAGIDTDFEGHVSVGGVAADRAPPPGFVFQDARLLPWLTAAGNVAAVNPSCSREQAYRALDRVGLAGSGHLYPHQLSGGMQRRVALARALAFNSGLLLLDEPFVSLDRVLLADMQALFASVIAQSRPTVVFVSHLIDDAVRLADRAVLLDHRPARIVADIAFPVPPQHRDAATLAAYRAALDQV